MVRGGRRCTMLKRGACRPHWAARGTAFDQVRRPTHRSIAHAIGCVNRRDRQRVNHKPLIEGRFRVKENGRTAINEQRINGRYSKQLEWVTSVTQESLPGAEEMTGITQKLVNNDLIVRRWEGSDNSAPARAATATWRSPG